MKCAVIGCEYNKNDTCSNLDNLEIMETGEGITCDTYKQSKEDKLTMFSTLGFNSNLYGDIIIIIANTYLGVSSCWTEINEYINSLSKRPEHIIVDSTLSNGIKDTSRYIELFKDDKIELVTMEQGYDKVFIKLLKTKTCTFLQHSNLLHCGIVSENQVKMIQKGIII